jgi:hypothetical protein
MVELGNPKSHETIMGECDPNKVEALLTAIDNGEELINWFVIFPICEHININFIFLVIRVGIKFVYL